MELSELVFFHNKLLTFSDRTGVVYEISDDSRLIPLWILADGNGKSEEGFKSEWATVKDDHLYVGSTGKVWEEEGKIMNDNRQWIKKVSLDGKIEHIQWSDVYKKLQNFTNTLNGFVVHEAVNWNPMDRRWYFLPRKLSSKKWSRKEHDEAGNQFLISCNESFEDWKSIELLGRSHYRHGFSSFKFVPFREKEEIVALETEELGDVVHSDLVVVNIKTGKFLLHKRLGDVKYEGIEIIKE